MTATCDACQAPLVWAKTTKGRNMPLDARRNERTGQLVAAEFENGNVADTGQVAHGHRGQLVPVVAVVEPGPRRWRSHFASCPHAERYRKRR